MKLEPDLGLFGGCQWHPSCFPAETAAVNQAWWTEQMEALLYVIQRILGFDTYSVVWTTEKHHKKYAYTLKKSCKQLFTTLFVSVLFFCIFVTPKYLRSSNTGVFCGYILAHTSLQNVYIGGFFQHELSKIMPKHLQMIYVQILTRHLQFTPCWEPNSGFHHLQRVVQVPKQPRTVTLPPSCWTADLMFLCQM